MGNKIIFSKTALSHQFAFTNTKVIIDIQCIIVPSTNFDFDLLLFKKKSEKNWCTKQNRSTDM